MKNKVCLGIGVSLAVLGVFFGGMTYARDLEKFYLEDVSGSREYLNLFPMEGVVGDGSHAMIFTIENGILETRKYPTSMEEAQNLLGAERLGLTGSAKYQHKDGTEVQNQSYASTEAAPRAGAGIETFDKIDVSILGEGYASNRVYDTEKMVKVDAVDIYAEIQRWAIDGSARFFTGISIMGEPSYFYRRATRDGNTSEYGGTYQEDALTTYVVDKGEAYYMLTATDERCVGESRLLRIQKDDLLPYLETLSDDELDQEIYSTKTYAEVEEVRSFSIDGDNRIVALLDGGKDALMVVRIQGGTMYMEQYNLAGERLYTDIMMEIGARSEQETNFDVIVFEDGAASIRYSINRLIKQEDENLVYEEIGRGLYQVNEMGAKRLKNDSYGTLVLAKNNLVLNVEYGEDEEVVFLPVMSRYSKLHFVITNGETGKELYHGRLVDDFLQDQFNEIAGMRLKGDGSKKEDINGGYYFDPQVNARVRSVSEILPMDGRRSQIWWR